MFVYEKKLQYPVRIKRPNPKLAAQIISQYGGPKCNWVQRETPRLLWETEAVDHVIFDSSQWARSS